MQCQGCKQGPPQGTVPTLNDLSNGVDAIPVIAESMIFQNGMTFQHVLCAGESHKNLLLHMVRVTCGTLLDGTVRWTWLCPYNLCA